jgi:hypothetical protein
MQIEKILPINFFFSGLEKDSLYSISVAEYLGPA